MIQEKRLEVKNRKVSVFGIKKSGIAAMKLLESQGALIFATEKEPEIDSSAIVWMEDRGIEFELGFHSRKSIESMDLIVISPGVSPSLPILQEAKKKGIPIIGEIELAYQFSNARFIGVTGTSGKSTTVELIGAILSKHLHDVHVCGNIGTPISKIVMKNPCKKLNLVVELSSFQLETIDGFRPEVAVFLNFNTDHMDRYSNMEEYFQAKKRIFLNQGEQDFALLNYDCSETRTINDLCAGKKLFSCKEKLENGFYLDQDHFVLHHGDHQAIKIPSNELHLPGLHNQSNALASLASSMLYLGEAFCPDKARAALREFRGLEHRFEHVGEFNGVTYINDSKSTKPETTMVALECVKQPSILILGGSDKGCDFSDLTSALIRHPHIKMVIVTGKTQRKIKHTFDALSYRPYKLTPSFRSAVFEAIMRSQPGDMVLLSPACASFDEFSGFEHRGQIFKELVFDSFRQNQRW